MAHWDNFMASILPSPEAASATAESSQQNTMQAQMEIDEGGSSSPVGLALSIQNELAEIIINPENHHMLRVPEHIKQLNPEVYKPQLISIGPIFHGQSELQPMEAFKKRYAKNFIEKFELEIQELIDITKEHEQMLREAYGMEPSGISSDELVKIMIIDGAFFQEFLLRHKCGTFEERDRMNHKKWNTFMCDLLLLENQIPCSYLKKLLDHVKQKNELPSGSLFENFLDKVVLPKLVVGQYHYGLQGNVYKAKHLLDFLTICMPYNEVEKSFDFLTICMPYNVFGRRKSKTSSLDPLTMSMPYNEFERRESKTSSSASCPTISQLHRAGIKFRCSNWHENTTIYFKCGTLAMSWCTINENTGRYFANLLASELSKKEDRYATDYIALMDYLIDGPEDVKILVENGILQNFLKDDKAAADLINEIGRSIEVHPNFLYSDMVENLNAYCENVWIKWKSAYLFEWKRDLKRNYFSNPWTALSVIAAVLLLGLTIAQTWLSYLQLKAQ